MATNAGATFISPLSGNDHAETTILRLFTADCCGAGDAMRTRIDDALTRDRNVETVIVEEIDVWGDPQSAVDSFVLTLPTLIVLRNGCEVARLAGLRSSRSINKAIAATGSTRRAKSTVRGFGFARSRANPTLRG